jgi:glycosyltransferase involved in cell wall biosynthesis
MPQSSIPVSRPGSILFLTQTAHPWGGVENWLEYLVPGLDKLGWNVTVGLVRGRRHHDPAEYLKIHPYRDTVEVPALTGTPEGRIRAIARALHRTTPDVVVPVNVADTLEAVRRVKAAGQKIRILYPLHGDLPDYLLDVAKYNGCLDFAVATNRRGHLALQRVGGLAPERTAHVAYGAPPPLVSPKFNDSPSVLRLAYVGRLVQDQKRILDLPAVCHELDRRGLPYHLDIAGTGTEEPWLREQLQSQVAAGRVVFHGFCSAEQLYQRIYPALTALVLLSDWETGPIVAWEAMRHGATVVTTRYRGLTMEGLLVPEVNSLVSAVGDPRGLAANLARLAAEPALLTRLRLAAFRTAQERCSIEASVQGWHEAFTACLNSQIAMELPPARQLPHNGRLDRVFGNRLAETLRNVFHRGILHESSGGEWPHSLSFGTPDCDQTAKQLALLVESDSSAPAPRSNGDSATSLAAASGAAIGGSPDP